MCWFEFIGLGQRACSDAWAEARQRFALSPGAGGQGKPSMLFRPLQGLGLQWLSIPRLAPGATFFGPLTRAVAGSSGSGTCFPTQTAESAVRMGQGSFLL